jgi:hypothetical protein
MGSWQRLLVFFPLFPTLPFGLKISTAYFVRDQRGAIHGFHQQN